MSLRQPSEETLVKNNMFHLPSRKKMTEDKTIEIAAYDKIFS